jgi:hypothetical protein
VIFHASQSGFEPDNKGLNYCSFYAAQCFQRVEIWLPGMDSNDEEIEVVGSQQLGDSKIC